MRRTMTYEQMKTLLNDMYYRLTITGTVKTKRELAELIGVSYAALCNAFGKDKKSLTPSLLAKVQTLLNQVSLNENTALIRVSQVPVVSLQAKGVTLQEYTSNIFNFEHEKMISPVTGAELAVQISDDSMAPYIPTACRLLIKKVDTSKFIYWGKLYVLDTQEGVMVKEIHPTENSDIIECRSINPKYESFHMHKADILGWYRILLVTIP